MMDCLWKFRMMEQARRNNWTLSNKAAASISLKLGLQPLASVTKRSRARTVQVRCNSHSTPLNQANTSCRQRFISQQASSSPTTTSITARDTIPNQHSWPPPCPKSRWRTPKTSATRKASCNHSTHQSPTKATLVPFPTSANLTT